MSLEEILEVLQYHKPDVVNNVYISAGESDIYYPIQSIRFVAGNLEILPDWLESVCLGEVQL